MEKASDIIATGFTCMTQEVLDNLMQRGLDSAYQFNAPEEEKDEMLRQWHGGKCKDCGKEYVKQRAFVKTSDDTIIADFEYFEPACRCIEKRENAEKIKRDFRAVLIAARIPKKMLNCNFENWDYGVDDKTNTAMKIVYDYVAKADFTKEGLICYGDVGTGKTHCAVAALRAAALADFSIRFCRVSGLVKQLVDRDSERNMSELIQPDCVLFDDLDKVSTYKSEWVRDQVFNLIDQRTNSGKITMATTNLIEPDEFVQKFGEATVSRLLGAALFVKFEGQDYRQKLKADKS